VTNLVIQNDEFVKDDPVFEKQNKFIKNHFPYRFNEHLNQRSTTKESKTMSNQYSLNNYISPHYISSIQQGIFLKEDEFVSSSFLNISFLPPDKLSSNTVMKKIWKPDMLMHDDNLVKKFVYDVQLDYKYEAKEIREEFILEFLMENNYDIEATHMFIKSRPDLFLQFIESKHTLISNLNCDFIEKELDTKKRNYKLRKAR